MPWAGWERGVNYVTAIFRLCLLGRRLWTEVSREGTKFSPSVRFLGTPQPGSLLTVFRLIPDNMCPFCSSGLSASGDEYKPTGCHAD